MSVSLESVSSILKQKRETENVEVQRKERCGRKRKTTKRDNLTLFRNSKINQRKTSEELIRDLDESGVHVSSSTFGRRVLEKERKARKPKKKQLLPAAMKKKRFNWEKNWSEDDWSRVLFSDESHFFVQGFNPKFFRCSPNEKLREEHFVQTVKHADKKMFWGCFSINGPRSLVSVEGMINTKAYLKIIERKVCKKFSALQPRAIFQQDSAPCHKAKMITNCFKKMKITVLDWPGNSPDLNPIKNLLSIVKNRLRKMDCTNKIKLI